MRKLVLLLMIISCNSYSMNSIECQFLNYSAVLNHPSDKFELIKTDYKLLIDNSISKPECKMYSIDDCSKNITWQENHNSKHLITFKSTSGNILNLILNNGQLQIGATYKAVYSFKFKNDESTNYAFDGTCKVNAYNKVVNLAH